MDGCTVFTTAEIVMGTSDTMLFTRTFDQATGFAELTPTANNTNNTATNSGATGRLVDAEPNPAVDTATPRTTTTTNITTTNTTNTSTGSPPVHIPTLSLEQMHGEVEALKKNLALCVGACVLVAGAVALCRFRG
jgi:hypothetical protein